MDVLTMVVAIVAISCAAGAYNSYLRSKKHTPNNDKAVELYAELDGLRERVEILEKIVTDDKFQLHKELEDLERRA